MNIQNRVGTFVPSEEEIQGLVKDVQTLAAKLQKYTLTLSAEDRRRTTKMRTRGEQIVELVGELAARNQVALPRISVADMKNDLALNRRLAPLAQELARISQEISDTMLQAQSECWWAATAFYSALARLSDADPQLESSLKPAVEFFAHRRRRHPDGATEPETKLPPRS
jgi:hypothetical protein